MESIASKRYDVVVIGGGQAGLAMGHFLAQRGLNFVILDAGKRTGDSWRDRWDSLTLFTPARYSALPGLRFPAEPDHLPHKDEVAGYLEHYAQRFSLPILYEQEVLRLQHISEWRGFAVETTKARFEADCVVIATGPFHTPLIPQIANAIGNNVVQMHSSQYRSPDQLPRGDVIVVGGGNSGVQIAAELAQTRRTWLSVGEKLRTLPNRVMNRSVFWWLDTLGMMNVNVQSRLGKRASQRDFLIGKSVEMAQQEDSVRLTGRAVGAEGNVIFMSDGAAIEAATVIWATGFRQDFSWVNVDVFANDTRPAQRRGVTSVPGLYFLGLPWQHTRGSALIGWVGRDAEYLAHQMG
jgi:putative flavoprotein involved in K+ transport